MKKLVNSIDKGFEYLSAITFGLVSIVVLIQVIARYTPGFSAPWTDETTRLLFQYTIFLSAPMAIKYKEYAVIDVFSSRFKGRARHILEAVIYLLVGMFSAVAARQAFTLFMVGFRNVSSSLQILMSTFYFVPFGIFLLTAVYSLFTVVGESKEANKGGTET